MFYLGIYIEKTFHVASLIDKKKIVIFKDFNFRNTTADTNLVLDEVTKKGFAETKPKQLSNLAKNLSVFLLVCKV